MLPALRGRSARSRLRRGLALGGVALLCFVLTVGAAANVNVAPSRAGLRTVPVTANDLKPPECAGISLSSVRVNANGTGGNELILGTSGNDTLSGGGGDDCILGGAGDDSLSGGGGNDVILGGPGNDSLRGNQGDDTLYGGEGDDALRGDGGYDRCFGGPGNATFHNSCEETAQ